MINEPLFQDYILQNLIRNFRHYFFETEWLYYAFGLVLFLYSLYFVLRKTKCSAYPNLFPSEKYKFDYLNSIQKYSLAFLCFILIIYATVIYSLDDSLFNNYDLMSLNTIFTFYRGLSSYYSATRLAPISFFDLNYLYAVTHNFNLINAYIILKQILIIYLFYNFLNFIPVAKRLITIGIIMLVPSVFWINNIIFPEQNMLIFMLLSLIFIKKYSKTEKYSNLWYFVLFTTLAVYTKETAIVFYTGILATGVLYNVFIEKINLSNIFRPFKLAKEMPVEFFIFMIALSFAVFYFFITDTSETNIYVVNRLQTYTSMAKLYKYEIIITLIGWIIFIKKLYKKEVNAPLFNEGFLVGGTFVLLYIICHLKITPIMEHVEHKSYYVILTAVFNTLYVFQNIHSKKLLFIIATSAAIYSSVVNYHTYQSENGWYYRETAEFLGQELKKDKKISIMFSSNSEPFEWVRENWSSSFAYYFPDYRKDITFNFTNLAVKTKSTNHTLFVYYRLRGYLTRIQGKGIPTEGDYYLIEKNKAEKDYKYIENIPHDLVFENKRFRIYKIK